MVLAAILAGAALFPMAAGAGPWDGRGGPEEPSYLPLPPPSLNFYGSPGLIDMPSAEMLPDGQFTFDVSHFGGQTRNTGTFQALPWLSASFRYNAIKNWNMGGFQTYYDRGFDVRFRLMQEKRYFPGITVGLQDFVGTGIYAAEYVVATKNFDTPGWGSYRLPGKLKVTAGLGWGRLGSYGAIGSPFGANRPPYDPTSTGGKPAYDQWFRGPMAPFGGIEWQPNDRWGVKMEYSSDAYVTETQLASVFNRKSPFNFGVEYQWTPRTRIGAYYLYGSEFGINFQVQASPYVPTVRMAVPAPVPIQPRPSRSDHPEQWGTAWADSRQSAVALRDAMIPVMRANGIVLESLTVTGTTAELRFRNLQYYSFSNAVGRAARVLTQAMPASVETFRLIPMQDGLALSAVTIRRSDLEALEFDPEAVDALLAVTGFGDATPLPGPTAVIAPDLYPAFSWSVGPYFQPSYFDPSRPFRLDVGLDLMGTYQPAPGWTVSGVIRQRLWGNIANTNRTSNSVLPHVRTDVVEYSQASTTLNNLFVSKQWRPGKDLYARVTLGYLEWMYGGISTELLWKPVNSRLGLGIEANYVRQREYKQQFGFRDYKVATGHVSAYYDMGGGFMGQVDVGRYLAGDVGATFAVDRVFDNGWSVGGFFTLTNVSAAEFGEGSFDKGIRFSIPVSWFLGTPGRQEVGTTILPIQRDGGQKLMVPGRLYGQVRNAHRKAMSDQWVRAWE